MTVKFFPAAVPRGHFQGGICAGNKAKICAKYVKHMRKNMRNPKNGVGSATPYLITHALLLTKYDDIFDQTEVLIILSTLKAPF